MSIETDRWTKDVAQRTKILNDFRIEMKSSNDSVSKSFQRAADEWMSGLKNRINEGEEEFAGVCACLLRIVRNSFLSFKK